MKSPPSLLPDSEPPPGEDGAVPLFAVEIEAGAEKALLMRIAQRLSWVGIEPVRLFMGVSGADETVRLEILFQAPYDRADTLIGQLRKLVAVSRVILRPALIAKRPSANKSPAEEPRLGRFSIGANNPNLPSAHHDEKCNHPHG